MRKNFGAKPWLYPQPVLIIATYGEEGTPDAMNAAWGGIADMNRIAMYLSGSHKPSAWRMRPTWTPAIMLASSPAIQRRIRWRAPDSM